ncbi:MAG: oligoendopeptidase F, partial [Atopostipes suicloacalis]|nr:oligoendopeptidase F [Atopostipes suicloacalis]
MKKNKSLPLREELPIDKTWDLTLIFKSDEEWEAAYQKANKKIESLKEYEGSLGKGSDSFLEALEEMLAVFREVSVVYTYAHLKSDQDTANSDYQAMNNRASSLMTNAQAASSWFEPELLSLSAEKIESYFEENSDLELYRHEIEKISKKREHVLSVEIEGLLASAGEVFNGPTQTFNVLNNADIEFPKVKDENGDEVQLSHGLYGQLLESKNREVRKGAFTKLYEVYEGLKNTFATTLQTNVKKNNYLAKAHHYESAREQALSNNHIPESVHETLIEVVNDNLHLLHRYMEVRKKLLGLEELNMYDLYVPMIGESSKSYSFEEATEKTFEGLEPLGTEYESVLAEAFDNRWIDVMENKGKRSGAYSSGSYDTAPYILLNWHDSLNHLYTLVHELGHSVHSYFTRNNQPHVYGDYSIFLAEIASTTNENLLTDHLLKDAKNNEEKAQILNYYLDGFKGTVFRQTQFAEFEHWIHTEDAKGTPLTADHISEKYGDLNQKYYGSAVENTLGIEFEWARIPHFYMNYYVYQYSTGFCAATALADRILTEEDHALEDYLSYLKAGNSDYPIEVMKKAGVDMTNKDYIVRAMKVFEDRLNQLEEIVK